MPKTILRIFSIVVILLLVAVLGILSTLSWSVPLALSKFLEAHDILLDIRTSRINLLKGELSLNDVKIMGVGATTPATAKKVALKIDAKRLARERILAVEYFLAEGVYAELTKSADNYHLNNIALPLEFSSGEPVDNAEHSGDATRPIKGFVLDNIKLKHAAIHLLDTPRNTQTLINLDQILVAKISSLEPDKPAAIALDLNIDDANLTLDGQARPLDSRPGGELDIAISSFDSQLLRKLLHFAPGTEDALASLDGLEFAIDAKSNVSLLNEPASTQVLLKQPQLTIASIEYTSTDENGGNQAAFDGHIAASKVDVILHRDDANNSTAEKAISPSVTIHTLTLRDGNASQKQIAQNDSEISANDSIKLQSIDIDVDTLNTASPTQSAISITAKNGKHGALTVKGNMDLLDYARNTALQITGEQVDLLPFSPTLEDVLNRRVKSGLLNFDSSVTIEARQLLASNNLRVDQFRLGKSQLDENQQEVNIGLPLNTALNLLRDKRDRIVLELPVSGSIDDPSFSLNPILRKAIFKSVKSAVTTQVGPLLAISALGKARDLSDALRLEAVPFTLESATLNDEAVQITSKLAAFLQRRQAISIRLCPYLNASEQTLRPPTDGSEQLEGDAAKQFLAEERVDTVKNALIAQGIEGQRIVPCALETDKNPDAKPRIQPGF